jgi:hypothetical protein
MIKILKALVASGAITQEVADQIGGEWKTHTKTLNDENKDLRTANEDLSKSFEEVTKSKSDLDTQLSNLDEQIAEAKKEGQKEVADQLEAEKASKVELQNSLGKLQTANVNLRLDRAVTDALKDFDVKEDHKDTTEFMLRSRVSMSDKGEVIYNQDGVESNIKDGFDGYFEGNESKLNPQGEGGSGAGGSGGSGGEQTKGKFGGSTDERKASIKSMIDADK